MLGLACRSQPEDVKQSKLENGDKKMNTGTTFDLTIRHGRISTANETYYADIGIKDGIIAAIAKSLPPGKQDVDAAGRWVLPGGIDSHCHV